MFECKACEYETIKKSNYDRHLKSKTHIDKIEKMNICSKCNRSYSNKSNKKKHEKKCKIVNNQIDTQINIENQQIINNNITINIIDSTKPEDMKSFVMQLNDLKNNKLTDCFQKIAIAQMENEESDLMDFIPKFKRKIENEVERLHLEHDNYCETGQCSHIKNNFKLKEYDLAIYLSEVLMSSTTELVITHLNLNLDGDKKMLFKHLKTLHDDEILLDFLNKSRVMEHFILSKDFKPARKIKEMYPDFYKTIEKKAVKILQKFNSKASIQRYL